MKNRKKYFACLFLVIGFFSACSDSSDDDEIKATQGKMKAIITIKKGFEHLSSISINAHGTPAGKTTTFENTGETDYPDFQLIEIPPKSQKYTFTTENASIKSIIIVLHTLEKHTFAYTVEYYLENKFVHTDTVKDLIMESSHTNATHWSIYDGFKRILYSIDGDLLNPNF